jgi:hypothetical protein
VRETLSFCPHRHTLIISWVWRDGERLALSPSTLRDPCIMKEKQKGGDSACLSPSIPLSERLGFSVLECEQFYPALSPYLLLLE